MFRTSIVHTCISDVLKPGPLSRLCGVEINHHVSFLHDAFVIRSNDGNASHGTGLFYLSPGSAIHWLPSHVLNMDSCQNLNPVVYLLQLPSSMGPSVTALITCILIFSVTQNVLLSGRRFRVSLVPSSYCPRYRCMCPR